LLLRRVLQLLVTAIIPSSLILFTLVTEAIISSEIVGSNNMQAASHPKALHSSVTLFSQETILMKRDAINMIYMWSVQKVSERDK
jgi:hypothetical protein